jgi:nucleoside-diphosphate-sugar epimerase
MRTLVTGGGGFLGGRIARWLLDRGDQVRTFQRSPAPELEALGVEVRRGDLTDAAAVAAACEGMEAVFHVAARAGYWGPRKAYEAINVGGTEHVIAGCRKHGARYLVHTSTPSVVFTGEAFDGADESLPYGTNFLCHYAETKARAEQTALAAHEPGSLEVCALRPHLIYGPGDPHLLPRVLARARSGRLRIVGEGDNRVDITHVANAAHGHLLALDALMAGQAGGRVYFLSDGRPVVLWDWIRQVLERCNVPPPRRRMSLRRAYALGANLEWLWRNLPLPGEPPMTRFVATELAKDHWFRLDAARGDLGYEPLIAPEDALAETVSWLNQDRTP